jgi:hypothetical protein
MAVVSSAIAVDRLGHISIGKFVPVSFSPAKDPLTHQVCLALADLATSSLLALPKGSPFRHLIEHAFAEASLQLKVRAHAALAAIA